MYNKKRKHRGWKKHQPRNTFYKVSTLALSLATAGLCLDDTSNDFNLNTANNDNDKQPLDKTQYASHKDFVKASCPQLSGNDVPISTTALSDDLLMDFVTPDLSIIDGIPHATYIKASYESEEQAKISENLNRKKYQSYLNAINVLNEVKSGGTFLIYIDSSGGSTDTAKMLIKAMEDATKRGVGVVTYAKRADSAASMIHVAGGKGLRISEARSFTIHPVRHLVSLGETSSDDDDIIKFQRDYEEAGDIKNATTLHESNEWSRLHYEYNSTTGISHACMESAISGKEDTELYNLEMIYFGASDLTIDKENQSMTTRGDYDTSVAVNYLKNTLQQRRVELMVSYDSYAPNQQ